MIDKIKDVLTASPMKGSRSKLGVLIALIALLAEQNHLVVPGTLINPTTQAIWAAAEAHFLIEHFETP